MLSGNDINDTENDDCDHNANITNGDTNSATIISTTTNGSYTKSIMASIMTTLCFLFLFFHLSGFAK